MVAVDRAVRHLVHRRDLSGGLVEGLVQCNHPPLSSSKTLLRTALIFENELAPPVPMKAGHPLDKLLPHLFVLSNPRLPITNPERRRIFLRASAGQRALRLEQVDPISEASELIRCAADVFLSQTNRGGIFTRKLRRWVFSLLEASAPTPAPARINLAQ